jgi:hypothetical protein
VWTWWTLLAVLFGRHEAGVSYVLLVPSAVAALAGLAVTLRRTEPAHGAGLAAILPLLAAGAVGFAPAFLLYEGIGARIVPAIAVLLALLISPAAPLIADLDGLAPLFRLGLTGVPIAAVALGAFLTVVVPAYSAKSPERVNFIYLQDGDTEKSKWVVEPNSAKLPEPLRVAAPFAREGQGVFPWSQRAAFDSEAPALEFAAPTFTVLESTPGEGKRSFAALLRSERGAAVAAIFFPPHSGVSDVRMEGVPIESEASTVRRFLLGWSAFECATMPSKGVEIRFSLPAGQPVEVYVQDESFGLPLEGSFLLKARPLTATESQNGDVSIVTRHVVLNP